MKLNALELDEREHNSQTTNKVHPIRYYHATPRNEILPLIALGVGIVGMYSFRALKRMDQEWEDYEEELREYNLNRNDDTPNQDESVKKDRRYDSKQVRERVGNKFSGGTMAIDLGTLNIRIAHMPNSPGAKPMLIVNREGQRATPNLILFESDGSFLSGQLAAAKLYERCKTSNPVVNTGLLITQPNDSVHSSIRNHMVEKVISSCATNALEQVLGRKRLHSTVLFSTDDYAEGYNVRPVFSYPPRPGTYPEDGWSDYMDALKNLSMPQEIALFRSEPKCAVDGAKFYSLLPSGPGPVMVIDVGANATSFSIVDTEIIQYHSRLDGFGGESLVEAFMNYLSKSFYGCNHDDVSDKMGVQRLYDAAKGAVMEISSPNKKNLGRVQINIPYLSVDEKMRPKHLNVGVSEKVLEAEFNDMVATFTVPKLAVKQNTLSNTMEIPNDLQSLFASIIMKTMESSNQNPFAFNSILVVGGGARSPLMQNAIKGAVAKLAGAQYVQDKVVIPRDELIEELVVLGATLS